MRKRIVISIAILALVALALHLLLHHSSGHGVMDALRRSVHGE